MIISLKNKLRSFDKLRRRKMHSVESLLYRVIKNDSQLEVNLLPTSEVKRILIIRQNNRIGNILFLITFIRQVRIAYPHAVIDLLLSKPCQGQYVEGLGVDNILYSHFSLSSVFKWFQIIKQLNTNQYDLLLASHCSASDAITSASIAARNKVSRYDERRILAFPNSLKKSISRKHAAHTCLFLLEQLGHQLVLPLKHQLAFSQDEINQGKDLSQEYIQEDALNLVFFRGARGAKRLSAANWEKILKSFEGGVDKKINWIEILSPDIQTSLRENTRTFTTSNMRLLGSFLKNFEGFLCCDTGPLHLADAADVKCLGVYTHTHIESFGLLGNKSMHITDINDFDARELVY